MSTWFSELNLPLMEGPKGWRPHWLHRGATDAAAHLTCHVSVLSAGRTPHELHSHPEEEILLVLDGTPELSIQERSGSVATHQAEPGFVAYYPADTLHTISNKSKGPATYLMFKWTNDTAAEGEERLPLQLHRCLPISSDWERRSKTWHSQRVFQGSTRWLTRLQCHTSSVNPGGGYAPHSDEYDVAILVLSGTIETQTRTLKPYDVAYIGAGESHGMRNVGPHQATYIVFEFERRPRPEIDGD